MYILLKTKNTKDGNIFYLLIDTTKKQYQVGYYINISYSDYNFTTTKKDINIIVDMLKKIDYNPIIKLG